jgi:hypothetical protein
MARFFAAIVLVAAASIAAPAAAQPAPDPAEPSAPAPSSPPAPAASGPGANLPPPGVAPPASPLTPPSAEGTGLAPPPATPYGYGQPGGAPGNAGYYGPYGYVPPAGPPPPPPEPPSRCCRWSVRYNPFDLIDRRLSFETEVAVAGPFAVEFDPSWIFGSATQGLDEKGVELGGRAVFYLMGKPMRGLWLKAHASYERYEATYTNQSPSNADGKLKASKTLASAILGALIGSSWVIGHDGGFTLTGGIGIGVATAPTTSITAPGDVNRGIAPARIDFYDKADRIRLLGSLSLGATF